MAFSYEYPRPALTTDVVLFRDETILLIRRKNPPFADMWALPGGFLEDGETLETCAGRELAEETGVRGVALSLVGVFSTPGRDPRGWTVSAAYLGGVPAGAVATGADDAAEVRWWSIATLPPLAFDHGEIIAAAIARRTPG